MMQAGRIVCAAAGKERGGYYVVVRTEGNFVFLADGKHRPLEKPKRKNVKHIRATDAVWDLNGLTNRALYRKLRESYAQLGG